MNDYREFYNFPDDWQPISLLNSTYLKGRIGWQGLKASEFLTDGPFLVTGTNFINGRVDWEHCYHITTERFREAPDIHLRENDLLITKDGTIGKVALVRNCPGDATLNSGIFLMRCKDGSYSHKFLYYFLLSDYFKKYLRDTQGGSTIVHLYQREFERFTFKAPGIPEQERIAEILLTVDAAIEQTQALIDKYGRIKRGLMQDLLTRGIDENGNLRSKETHKFTVKNGIEVPDEWEVVSLAHLRKSKDYLRTGPFGSSLKISDWAETGIPVITIGSLGENTIDPTNLLFVDQRKAETLSLYRLEPGDVLFSRVADVGRSLVITDKEAGWIMSSNFMRLRIDSQRMLPTFLHINLKENGAVKNQILKYSNYGGRDLVNSEVLNSLYFPKPNPLEQERIIEKVHAFERDGRSLDKLQSIKKGLMQDLLSGRKRVKVDA